MRTEIAPVMVPMQRLYTSVLKITGVVILFFTMFGGFVRFAPLPSLVWMGAYCAICLSFIFNPRHFIRSNISNWSVFLIPVFALTSTLWSVAPMKTVMAAFQLTMTVFIAVWIAQNLTTRQVMLALFLAQGAGLLLSIINLGVEFIPPRSVTNGTLMGIYGHKTALGYSAILSAYALISWLCFSNHAKWGFLYAILIGPLVFSTASVTAMLGYVGIFLLLFLRLVQSLPPLNSRRVLALCGIAFCLAVFGGIMGFIAFEDQFLGALGKNATLTGRTVLWEIAFETWVDMPITGVGFSAFWHSAVYAHDVSFVHSYVDDRVDGFHNAFVEVTVALGLIGLVLLVFVTFTPMVRLFARIFLNRSLPALIWLGLLITYVLPAMFIQDVGFKQHSGSYVMLVLCYCFSTPSRARRDSLA